MIAFPAGAKVWIAGGVTDMRCGMNSLALKVQQGSGARSACGGALLLPWPQGRSAEDPLA